MASLNQPKQVPDFNDLLVDFLLELPDSAILELPENIDTEDFIRLYPKEWDAFIEKARQHTAANTCEKGGECERSTR